MSSQFLWGGGWSGLRPHQVSPHRSRARIRLQNSRFRTFSEGWKRRKRGVWGEKTTVGFSYNEFFRRRGRIMLLRWQKLLDSSTHILNVILWMPYFRAKFAVLSSKAWSFVHSVQWWFGKDERFCFSVNCRMCPCQKRLKSVKWIKQHRKKRPHVEEESQKKRQRRTIADCVCVVLKHSLEIDFCCV